MTILFDFRGVVVAGTNWLMMNNWSWPTIDRLLKQLVGNGGESTIGVHITSRRLLFTRVRGSGLNLTEQTRPEGFHHTHCCSTPRINSGYNIYTLKQFNPSLPFSISFALSLSLSLSLFHPLKRGFVINSYKSKQTRYPIFHLIYFHVLALTRPVSLVYQDLIFLALIFNYLL